MLFIHVFLILANVAMGLWQGWAIASALHVYGVDRIVLPDFAIAIGFTVMLFLVPWLGWRLRDRAPGIVVAAVISLPIVAAVLMGWLSFSVRMPSA